VIARPFAELLEDGRVAIHAVKAVYVLTAGEVVALLPCCKSLWIVAARRGKVWRRAEALERRQVKAYALAAADDSTSAGVVHRSTGAAPLGKASPPPCLPPGGAVALEEV
jgi:hypothetical protein